MADSLASRLNWPHEGVAVRVPPRRIASGAVAVPVMCEIIAFKGAIAEAPRTVSYAALENVIPRAARVVLLVAAEDVLFTAAEVPPLSGARLREALPNLVEESTVGEVGSLHVAPGTSATSLASTSRSDARQTLAVVDRAWLAAMQAQLAATGRRVVAVLPEALCTPFAATAWTLAAVPELNRVAANYNVDNHVDAASETHRGWRMWLRTDAQQAFALPDDTDSAVAIVAAAFRHAAPDARPAALELCADAALKTAVQRVATAISSVLDVPLRDAAGDPFAAWLAGGGPHGAFGAPLSLLAQDAGSAAFGARNLARWRVAALLVVAIVVVQAIGMQWQWTSLRREAASLRAQATAALTSSFPETRVVLDAPLQMSRSLATLRASAGRSDPADFSVMLAASGKIFAELPTSALRALDYDARALHLRFAPGIVSGGDDREKLIGRAAQAGYALRFEPAAAAAPAASGETAATLLWKGGA